MHGAAPDLRTMFDAMIDGCAIVEIVAGKYGESDLRMVEMNDAFCRQSGLDRNMLGRPARAWPDRPAPAWLARCRVVAETGQPARVAQRNADHDRWYEMQFFNVAPGRVGIVSRDISARKRAEEKLREGEHHLWQILAGLPGMVWSARADGQVDFASPQWTSYTGLNHIGQRGSEWTRVLHPEDRAGALATWTDAITTSSAWHLECRLRRHDGQYHWFAWRGTPLHDGNGKVVRWFGVCTDIDDLKRTQERLQESERRYSVLFGNHTMGIAHYLILTDATGQPENLIVEQVNQAYERILDVAKAAIEGKIITEVFPQIRQHEFDFIGTYGKIGLEGGEGRFEVQTGHNDRWLSVYAYSARHGECTAMITEITEQKRAATALRESEEILRATFEQAAVGIALVSPDGRFNRVNRTLAEMTGFSEQEICGKHILDLTYPADREIGIADFKRAVAGEIASFSVEKRYLRRNKSIMWARITGSSVRDQKTGTTKYNVAIIEDISARKHAEERHASLMEQLHAAATHADQSRAQLEAVFQSISDGIAVFDMDANMVLLNDALARVNGFPTRDDMQRPLNYFTKIYELHLADGSLLPVEQWPISRVLRGETLSDWELHGYRRDIGQSWFFSYSGAPVHDEQGKQVLAVVTAHDVTERKRLEQARKESERRLQLAVAIAHLGFWEWEVASGKCYYSPVWKKQLGYQDDELPNTPEQWQLRLHPEDRQRVLAAVKDYLAHPSPDYRLEYRLRHRDGSYRWMIANAVQLSRHENAGVKLLGTQLDVTENKLAEQRVREAAQHDPLTGLPNRALIFEYAGHLLAASRRNHGKGAFLFIDLDRFKPVNDLYGHEIGDKLLQEVAKRLVRCVRNEDLVGRLGGDEFVVVLPHAGKMDPAATVAQHVLDALALPFEIEALDLSISASIGISYFPQHGTDVDALIHAADLAMYQAKQNGHGSAQVFSNALTARADASSSIEARLKRALARGGLILHYQPVMDMKSKRVIGAEALLRLADDSRPVVGPDRFVPIAESAGLIGPLGEWVVAEACRQHAAWCSEGLPPLAIAINVSPLQFRQRGFASKLADIILDSAVDPAWIQIEVTESTVMDNVDDAIVTLNKIRAAGIRIALDDFGTGYSSLSHLSNLPLDKLKVDQSFVKRIVHDKASRAITGAIIMMGRTLNLEVVGEGIETEEALNYLQQHDCDQAQGFFISHPLPAAEFSQWYRERSH